jgi:GH15 family glucan-1,4-alpha-glucosidase
MAEEYHPTLRRQLGNYPQAFSHVGLINSAVVLEAKRRGREPTFPATLAEAVH